MSPIVEHAAMALVALSDAKHHIRMVSRMIGSSESLDMLIFDIEKMNAEVLAAAKAAQGVPVTGRLA